MIVRPVLPFLVLALEGAARTDQRAMWQLDAYAILRPEQTVEAS
jgi:hypothetical protein